MTISGINRKGTGPFGEADRFQFSRNSRYSYTVILSPRSWKSAWLFLLAPVLPCLPAGGRSLHPSPFVAACPQVTLKAQYLAEVTPGSGPGFHFLLENHMSKAIRLAMPVPSSAHWFAQESGRWLWRASNGAGGSLVHPEQPRGQMFAYQLPPSSPDPTYLAVPARGNHAWDESARENPVLLFKPSCRLCNHPDDRLYRVVFAYAYLPRVADGEVLRCGLRSNFVDVPPGHY